jgi:hypothetical protein
MVSLFHDFILFHSTIWTGKILEAIYETPSPFIPLPLRGRGKKKRRGADAPLELALLHINLNAR